MSKEQMCHNMASILRNLPEADVEKLLYVIKGMELSNLAATRSA